MVCPQPWTASLWKNRTGFYFREGKSHISLSRGHSSAISAASEETAGTRSGWHITVGSTVLLSEWTPILPGGSDAVLLVFLLFIPGLRSVADVQWVLQKCFINQLRMNRSSQTSYTSVNHFVNILDLLPRCLKLSRFHDRELGFS